MPVQGHDPAWPDKAMFAAILLILAGALGILFRLVRPLLTIDDKDLLALGDPTSMVTAILCAGALLCGVACLIRQAAVFAYAGAAMAILSLGVYGLVPALGLLAVGAIVLSHREGEETVNDGVQLHPALWPDKAMAASLFLVVVGGVAITQGILMLAGKFDPILLTSQPVAAGVTGILIGLFALVAARETYRVQHPWMAWTAFVLSLGTLGFYLIGPLFALVGMVLLGFAHREGEYDEFAADVLVARNRRKKPKAAAKPAKAA